MCEGTRFSKEELSSMRTALAVLDRERLRAYYEASLPKAAGLDRQEAEDLFDACNSIRRLLGIYPEPKAAFREKFPVEDE